MMVTRRLLPTRFLAPVDRVQHVADFEHAQEQYFEMLIRPQCITPLDKFLNLRLGRTQIGIEPEHADGCKQEVINQKWVFCWGA